MGASKFIASILLAGSSLTAAAQAAPPTAEQLMTHHVASQIPLTVKDGKIVPEDGVLPRAIEESAGVKPTPALMEHFNKYFKENARPVVPMPSQSSPAGKTYFMVDPYEMVQGLPYKHRLDGMEKWNAAKTLIEAAGGNVVTGRGADMDGGLRETFTRDRYVVVEGKAYLPDPQAYAALIIAAKIENPDMSIVDTYKSEIDQAEKMLKSQGVPVVRVAGAWFEGGNVIIDRASSTIFMGLETDRDNAHSLGKLAQAVNAYSNAKPYDAMGVPLVNGIIYYHLDLGMSEPLPKGGEVLLSPHVTDAQTLSAIQKRIGQGRIIKLGENEEAGATNLVTPTRDTIVLTTASPDLMGKLSGKGYQVFHPGMQNKYSLTIASGGVHCMTNEIPVARAPKP